jgi:hypothetical protein
MGMQGTAKEVSGYLGTLLCLGEIEGNLQLKQRAKVTKDLPVRHLFCSRTFSLEHHSEEQLRNQIPELT